MTYSEHKDDEGAQQYWGHWPVAHKTWVCQFYDRGFEDEEFADSGVYCSAINFEKVAIKK